MTEQQEPQRGEFDDLPTPGPEQDGVVYVNALGFAFECVCEHDVFVEGDTVWLWRVTGYGRRNDDKEIL